MYDPNEDAEEKLKKLAIEKLLINNAEQAAPIASAVQAPTAASIGLNLPEPAVPPTFFEQMQPYLARMGQNAEGYSGSGFVSPVIDPVQRGGGLLQASSIPMAAYGQGLVHQFGKKEEDDKSGSSALRAMIAKALGR
tara:strand:+ start:188 stop:598 length:411 start_codon:yes stop_codon:yes gene_type:complete